ncbi:MAG: Gfo/Idh/MocA family oxidoreductase [Planctomycetota bacterium]|nr:Gfo/Idh/MocA family oxidoreductase [Planctomycetota bacterium]MDA1222067.1 Gfo/Idh/MocA family oxidoreductase [Planctomycetota bacterium]
MTHPRARGVSRRQFIASSGAAVASTSLAPSLSAGVHIGGDEVIKVGLIGCGGRGTGAARQALKADASARLVAMGDAFIDRLEPSLNSIKNSDVGPQVVVDEEHKFTGFEAYKSVIDSVDVVLLCATPHFRPRHLRAAIEAGKHVFCEKPVAVDAPGVRHVMETCRMAKEKNLNVVSGLCYRYQDAKRDVIQKVHEGAVGDIVSLQCTYNTGFLWHRGRQPEWSEMEYQLRNWLYWTWLSGDHIAEQSIHSLDKILWAMKDVPPAKVTASGGRIVRTDPKFGNIFDHFNTVFEWESGPKLFHSCRQWGGADADVSDYVFGTKGTAALQSHYVTGENEWRFRGRPSDMYQQEHDEFFAAMRNGTPINNGDYMCKSTLMAIMGRMSAYTGKTITWEQALNSQLDLTPAEYAWGDIETRPVAQPGVTPFI